jgi:hypothetical protein
MVGVTLLEGGDPMRWTVVALALLAAVVFRLVPVVFADQPPRVYSAVRAAAAVKPITVPTEHILEP